MGIADRALNMPLSRLVEPLRLFHPTQVGLGLWSLLAESHDMMHVSADADLCANRVVVVAGK